MVAETQRSGAARVRLLTTPILAGLLALAAAPIADAQWAPPLWPIERAGLADAEHTDAAGYQQSVWLGKSSQGRMIGTSSRFAGGSATGLSAWVWGPGMGSVRCGFVDAQHTAADGSRSSTPRGLAGNGRVIGVSQRYSGGVAAGQSAWTWQQGEALARLGFTDAPHTSSDGTQSSDVRGVCDGDRVVGVSSRYSGPAYSGQSAWTWTPASGLLRLGYTDAAHTSSAGAQSSDAVAVIATGQTIGSSKRYAGAAERGESAWVWSAGVTIRVGLIDAAHTSTNGQQTSRPTAQNSLGQVIGTSANYRGLFYAGDSAWTWTSSGGTVRIGLFDAGHTSTTGDQYATATAISAGGLVTGYSSRYSGLAETGRSAWVWSGTGGTVRLGLIDAEHTGAGGYQYSNALRVSDAGVVIGYSSRYLGGADGGSSAWTWSAAGGLVRLGPSDAAHTRSDGYRVSWPVAVNSAGQVVGYAERYSGTTWLGNDGWFYDPSAGSTQLLVFSESGGSAMTAPTALTDDGRVIGNYRLYSSGVDVGYRAFVWSPADGFGDLGSLVDGGLAAHGWGVLTQAFACSASGLIGGYGTPAGSAAGSQGVFVLTMPRRACGPADIGVTGGIAGHDGELNNNDFIVYINNFFNADPSADIGVTGGVAGHDGAFDNNDFIVFIDLFFAGC